MSSNHHNPVAAYARFEDEHWWFSARRQILRRMVATFMQPSGESLIIDVGCGPGGNLASFAGMFQCLGIDSSEAAIQLARARFPTMTFVCGNAPRDIAEQAMRADLWLLMDVLEHVDDDISMLQSLVAAAKPGAYFFITVPAEPALWSPHDDAAGHRRRYTATTLRSLWAHLPVDELILSGYNTRLYWPVKAIRAVNARLGRTHGASQAEGLDLRLPPTPFNGILTGLFANEGMRLAEAIAHGGRGYKRGVSLLAVIRRRQGDVEPPLDTSIPTSALTKGELGAG